MKFFRKHKKKVLALCLSAVLLSCFMGFSISSSAYEVIHTQITPSTVCLTGPGWVEYPFSFSNGVFDFDTSLPNVPTDSPYFYFMHFRYQNLNYTVPSVEGKAVNLFLEMAFDIDEFGYLSSAYSTNPSSLVNSAIFTGYNAVIYFSDGTQQTFSPSNFAVFDTDSGTYADVTSNDFWARHVNSPFELQLYGSIDLSNYTGKNITEIRLYFPNGSGSSRIYYSDDSNYLAISNLRTSFGFYYLPISDIVNDGFTSVNNRLDFISSSMNTIDQDINRVNQTVSDLKDSFEDFQDDLTTPNTDISSSNSQLQDKITDVQDQISSIDKEVNDAVDGVLDKVPGAENPFVGPDVPVLGDIWAKQFIDDLWGFIKSYSILYTFIHTGLLFCLASFILRR